MPKPLPLGSTRASLKKSREPIVLKKHEITTMLLDDLHPASWNPRTISKKAADGLEASLARFGLVDPLIVNKRTGYTVIGGHQRYSVMMEQGIKDAQVVVVDLSEAEERALNVVLNNPHIAGEWSDELASLLDQIRSDGVVDFNALMLDKLLAELNLPVNGGLTDPDAVPEAPKKPVTKLGNLWMLGSHRLMCGDALNLENIKFLVGDLKVDLVFTDPPYGINAVKVSSKSLGSSDRAKAFGKTGKVGPLGRLGFQKQGHVHGPARNAIVKPNLYFPVIGDDSTDTAKKSYGLCVDLSIQNFIIWGGNYFTDFLRPSRCWAIWDKQNAGNFADVEMAWTSFDKPAKLYSFMWNGLAREGDRKSELIGRVHPTQKPVGLFVQMFRDFAGSIILDLFGGSGSTLIACQQTDRRCLMMELSPAYCDVIVRRWEDFTGQKAQLAKI